MDPAAERMVRLWDTLADSYDQVGVDFFGPIAGGLVDALDPGPGERAVDLGCGRGAALLELARRVGPSGRAFGGDLSPGMVAACADLARREGLSQVEVRVVDAQAPDVDAVVTALGGPADIVASSLVVFFLPDPAAALARWVPLVRPGGRVGLATFGDRDPVWTHVDAVFDPYLPPRLLDARTTGARGPFTSDAGVEDLLRAAGFTRAHTRTTRVTVRFADAEHWHRFTMSLGQRAFWELVPENRRDAVRDEAFARLAPAAAPDGSLTVWQDARYTVAERA
jgi:SAM-dependent methyltransferase